MFLHVLYPDHLFFSWSKQSNVFELTTDDDVKCPKNLHFLNILFLLKDISLLNSMFEFERQMNAHNWWNAPMWNCFSFSELIWSIDKYNLNNSFIKSYCRGSLDLSIKFRKRSIVNGFPGFYWNGKFDWKHTIIK